jgi:orotate phosphoribosyltransferase-like protein
MTQKRNARGQFVKLSTAARIRRLQAKGLTTAQIATELGIRFQQVRNTLVRDAVTGK